MQYKLDFVALYFLWDWILFIAKQGSPTQISFLGLRKKLSSPFPEWLLGFWCMTRDRLFSKVHFHVSTGFDSIGTLCGSLHEKCIPRKLWYLNSSSSVGDSVWKGGKSLLEKVEYTTGVCFENWEPCVTSSSLALCILLVAEDVISQHPSLAYLSSPALLPHPDRTISLKP